MNREQDTEFAELVSRCVREKSSFEAMKSLELLIAKVSKEQLINEVWSLISVARDTQATADESRRATERLEKLLKEIVMNNGKREIHIQGGNVNVGHAGDNAVTNSAIPGSVGSSAVMTECSNKIVSSGLGGDVKSLLEELQSLVSKAVALEPDAAKRSEIERDLTGLVAEVTAPSPRRKWYELSGEGLIDATHAVLGVGERVAELVPKIARAVAGLH